MNKANNEKNRKILAHIVWETLSADDIYQQFIHTTCAQYERDDESFIADAEWLESEFEDALVESQGGE
tara:strand:- start:26 stop:229 length:204 start_codon:yes stop_codon:yes gene_type:complete